MVQHSVVSKPPLQISSSQGIDDGLGVEVAVVVAVDVGVAV
ncbi:MAG: hypothetical protein ACE5I2_11610 [Anaerolineae bacterium]